MAVVTIRQLLDSGVHFGHQTQRWNPKVKRFILTERSGIHIIDLNKTLAKLEEATEALKQMAKSGKKILFVATKKQAKEIVSTSVKNLNMPYVTERWPGGMLTNFATIRKAVKKMSSIDKMATDGTWENINKKERLFITREREKLEKTLGSIADLTRLPAALFIVDIHKEHIAVAEARRLGIITFGIVDTNSDPNLVDFAIPANDDSTKSIQLIMNVIAQAVQEGLSERKMDKEKEGEDKEGEAAEATEGGSEEEGRVRKPRTKA